jgi:hypothetical protein
MKLRAILMAATLATTFFASTRVASAQQPLIVTIPFDFAAGSSNLPAGDYSVKASQSSAVILLMNRENPGVCAIVAANSAAANQIQTQSKLVFHRYGDRYFLSQVWTEGNDRGKEVPKTAREKETALVAAADTRGQVTLVASLR